MVRKIFMAFVVLIILVSSIAVINAADVDVVRDFDNVTVYHAVKSDSSSQAVYGLENNAKLIGRDKVNHTEPVSRMANTEVKVDNGYYTYQHLVDENGLQLNPTDRVKFNFNRTLTAVYKFTPYMFAEIVVNDAHGHSASTVTYPAMKTDGDSVTKTFKDATDVEDGWEFVNIRDVDTNETYMPGDKYTITYSDVLATGTTKLVKTFEYVYKEVPKFNASITIIDPVGNAGGFVDFANMEPNDSLHHVFREPVDVDTVHYEFWYIVDETGSVYLQPNDEYCISYDNCLAINESINKVFTYKYGYFPDYTVTYISSGPNGVFDNRTFVINRENWSAFYTLPEAPTVDYQVLDFIYIVEDDIYNYNVGDVYQVDYDMTLCEGNNITRHFVYYYKDGAYSNVTVNYILNIDNEMNGTIFHSEYFPMLVVGEEIVGGYVDYHPNIDGYNFTGVTFNEVIINSVKGILPGSDISNEGGFWIYEVNETGDIDLNFVYNYEAIKVDPTPEPTPTPTPGNDTVDNDTNETDPVVPTPTPGDDVVDNETNPVQPANNDTTNTNTTTTNMTNENTTGTSTSNNIETVRMKQTGNHIAWFVLFLFISLFIIFIVRDED